MSRVVVFGTGFDSLLAVHAASVQSHDVKVYADAAGKEKLAGPQLLKAPIPMVNTDCAPVLVHRHGHPDALLDKLLNQGGKGYEPEFADTGTMLWDAQATYDQLFDTYAGFAVTVTDGIYAKQARAIIKDLEPDYVISGVDRDDLCDDRNHSYAAGELVAMETLPCAGTEITYSGDTDDAWGIQSNLFGQAYRLYGGHRHPPVSPSKLNRVLLPQGSSCSCFVGDMDFVGVRGAWDHQWRRHESFYRSFQNLDGLSGSRTHVWPVS